MKRFRTKTCKLFARAARALLACSLLLALLLPSALCVSLAVGDTTEGSLEDLTLYNVTNSSNSNKKYYQHSDYRMRYTESGNYNYSFLRTFLLMTKTSTSGASPTSGWSAAKAKDANYMVGYCADWRTASVVSGEDSGRATYDTLTMDNSRLSDSKNRDAIEGVINNAYPFITKAEMDRRLSAAGLATGTEADYIAAAQMAIWELFTLDLPSYTFHFRGFVGADNSNTQVSQAGDLAPISNKRASAGLSNTQMKAIVTWLKAQRAPAELALASFTESDHLTRDADGTYTATVALTLNRALLSGEQATASVVVGGKNGEAKTISAGAKSVTVSLSGLEYDEVKQNGIRVTLNVEGAKMSVYYFDSVYYQDMVSGMQENYTRDLSFDVASGSTTSVSASKVWADGSTPTSSVRVHLLANGIDCQKTVTLSAANSWTHLWENLPTTNAFGEAITYTVYEEPVAGHYCVTTTAASAPVTRPVWIEQTSGNLTSNGTYMFVCDQGALSYEYDDRLGRRIFSYTTSHKDDATKTPQNAIWVASSYSSNGATFVSAKESSLHLGFGTATYTMLPTISSGSYSKYYFIDGKLSTKYSGTSYYYNFIYEYDGGNYSGKAATTTSKSAGEPFTLYKKGTAAYNAATDYVLTNYPITTENERKDVTVQKTWSGKPNEQYPADCTVTLLQNGVPFGAAVTLSSENGWAYTWSDLPTVNASGGDIVYSVKEEFLLFYTPTVRVEEGTDAVNILLDNEWTPEELFARIAKTDTDDLSLRFENIPFAIWQLDESGGGQAIPGTDKFGHQVGLVTTGTTLEAAVTLDVDATYYILEQSAPFGYSGPEEPIVLSVSRSASGPIWSLVSGAANVTAAEDGTPLLLAQNDAGYVLPETGGIGTTIFYILGGVLLCGGGIWLFTASRFKKHDNDENSTQNTK